MYVCAKGGGIIVILYLIVKWKRETRNIMLIDCQACMYVKIM